MGAEKARLKIFVCNYTWTINERFYTSLYNCCLCTRVYKRILREQTIIKNNVSYALRIEKTHFSMATVHSTFNAEQRQVIMEIESCVIRFMKISIWILYTQYSKRIFLPLCSMYFILSWHQRLVKKKPYYEQLHEQFHMKPT